ncbi:MAG: hypothetical protein KAR35_11375 [Candidatus Heimdallarchaeota archaeon]|nr:hypothetical protein [Candidatus Heimdallarchaeota archaeon]MCK5049961.1 hypothetical protein [Candidatus Heimdallarchaeota archaeon]
MKFKIKKKFKEDTVIEITEMSKNITVGDLLYDEKKNKKSLTEIEAMVKIEKAKITNIKNNHPEVLRLDKKMLIGAYLYYQSSVAVKQGNDKIKQLNNALKNLTKDKKEITKQTGFNFEQFKNE